MTGSTRVVVSEDFSRFPAGRFTTDGPFSGQRFRESLLAPYLQTAIEAGTRVQVVLDGTRGYGSSFLEEAFGGLVRNHGLSIESIISALELDTVDDALRAEILGYIKSSKKKA